MQAQGPEYREMRANNRVLEYIKTHRSLFPQLTAEFAPSKNTMYRLFETTNGPKQFILSVESVYQGSLNLNDKVSSPIKMQLTISEPLMYRLQQLSRDILEQPYASIKSFNIRQRFRERLFSLPSQQRVEALNSQSREDLERLKESVEKCFQAHQKSSEMTEPQWSKTLSGLFSVQSEINTAIGAKRALYERTFGKKPGPSLR